MGVNLATLNYFTSLLHVLQHFPGSGSKKVNIPPTLIPSLNLINSVKKANMR